MEATRVVAGLRRPTRRAPGGLRLVPECGPSQNQVGRAACPAARCGPWLGGTPEKPLPTDGLAATETKIALPVERVLRTIHVLRGQKVILDADLAALYDVETKALTRAVRRNSDRFPPDFMFQLNEAEFDALRRQIGASSAWGGRRYPPYAFTEQGVAMLSSVLRGPRAVQVNIGIMRAFVELRRMLASSEELSRRLDALEAKYDDQFQVVFGAIRQLMSPTPKAARRAIGFAATPDGGEPSSRAKKAAERQSSRLLRARPERSEEE